MNPSPSNESDRWADMVSEIDQAKAFLAAMLADDRAMPWSFIEWAGLQRGFSNDLLLSARRLVCVNVGTSLFGKKLWGLTRAENSAGLPPIEQLPKNTIKQWRDPK